MSIFKKLLWMGGWAAFSLGVFEITKDMAHWVYFSVVIGLLLFIVLYKSWEKGE